MCAVSRHHETLGVAAHTAECYTLSVAAHDGTCVCVCKDELASGATPNLTAELAAVQDADRYSSNLPVISIMASQSCLFTLAFI